MCSDDALIQAIHTDGAVFLDGSGWMGGGGLLFTSPEVILQPRSREELIEALEELDAAADRGRYVAGFFTYEAGEHLLLDDDRPIGRPLAWLGIYPEAPVHLNDDPKPNAQDVAATRIDFRPNRAAYSDAFAAVKHHIREGDVYQINLTGRGSFRYAGNAIDLYRQLRRRQPAAYGALINTGDRFVMSFSPELFFERDGKRIRTRPMKGTAPRDADPARDEVLRQRLASDPKNRAENLMIVDLIRNDLSIVCEPGSVNVERMFEVEPLPTLWQMTSEVSGILRPGSDYRAILSALFPSGSITGAPKKRAMEIIREVEPAPRGIYCGAIGFVAPADRAVFNVAIRTVEVSGEGVTVGAGGGIVWDSDEPAEFEEMHLKTRFCGGVSAAVLEPGFHLIETMKGENGKVPLLDLHLIRLERSARYFGLVVDINDVRRRVEEVATAAVDPCTIRLTVDRSSTVSIEELSARSWGGEAVRIGVAPTRVRSTDPFLYHKTSRREVFDRMHGWATEQGLDEAILLNERGEITEGTRTSVFVRCGERWLTPALTCGVLPGVFRARMFEGRDVEEEVLRPDDLASADEIIIGNAVRGKATAVLVDVPSRV